MSRVKPERDVWQRINDLDNAIRTLRAAIQVQQSGVSILSGDGFVGVVEPVPGEFILSEGTGGGSGPGGTGIGWGPVVDLTSDYTVLSIDDGNVFRSDGSSLSHTLPNPVPAEPWAVTFVNTNASDATIGAGSIHLDGTLTPITLAQDEYVTVWADTSSYVYGTGIGLAGPAGPTGPTGPSGGGGGGGSSGVASWLSSAQAIPSPVSIVAVSVANPGVITTSVPHLLTAGQFVDVSGVLGSTEINGNGLTVTVVDSTNFTVAIHVTHAFTSSPLALASPVYTTIGSPITLTTGSYRVLAQAAFTQTAGKIDIAIMPHGDSNILDALTSLPCAETGDEDWCGQDVAATVTVSGSSATFDVVALTASAGFIAQPLSPSGFGNATGISAS